MREIKFRAWDSLKQKMIYWTLNDLLCRFDIDTGYNQDDRPSTFFEWMQYTGLKDKNGKEIYEGDICIHHYFHHNGHIEWVNGALVLIYDDGIKEYLRQVDMHHYEIIGNIYENPKLLSD